MKRRIAFFDFDGTITSKDSLPEMIKYYKGPFLFYLGVLVNSPILVAYKFKIISNSTAKQRLLTYFFKRTPVDSFVEKCEAFVKEKLFLLIRPKALKEIRYMQNLGAEVVIISASASYWIKSWADQTGVKLISTHLEVSEERLTGRIDGKNCYGDEKVRRIKAEYDLGLYDEVYCYGDSPGDQPMLALATFSFYKPFR